MAAPAASKRSRAPPPPPDFSSGSFLRAHARSCIDWFTRPSCEAPEGALYAFPQLRLPARAVEAARAAGKQPDTFYCLGLLDATGICVVPGSGFGQREGTWHFRTTILPPEADLERVVALLSQFHSGFMDKYR